MRIAARHARAVEAHVVRQLAHPPFALLLVVVIVDHVMTACMLKHGEVVDGYVAGGGPAASRCLIIVIFWDFLFVAPRRDIVAPHGSCPCASSLSQIKPPVPGHNECDVEEVKGNHTDGLPQVQLPVDNEAHAESSGDKEEADITNEALACNLEGADQGHGARDDGGDEACSTNELAHGQACSVGAEGGKGGKDIGAAISKGEQRHASQTLAHAQHARNRIKIDAEEVAGSDANGAEEEGEP